MFSVVNKQHFEPVIIFQKTILKKNENLNIINLVSQNILLSVASMSTDSTISPKKREQLQKLFARGSEAMSKANYEYADFYFTDCVLRDPGNLIYAKTFLANLKKKLGEKKKTTRSLVAMGKQITTDAIKPDNLFKVGIEALKSNPWAVETLISTGEACEALGHVETAVLYYQSAVDADPQHIGANTICCSALQETADFDGAIACLHRLLQQKPNDLDLRRKLNELSAEKAIHRGKYATGASRETVESAGTTIVEDVMGRSLTVEEQIERRIAKNPQDTANYIELAQWHLKYSDYVKAEECYARAVLASENAPDMVERLLETQKKRLYAETLHLKHEYEQDPQEERKSIFLAVRDQYDTKNMELAWHRVQYCPEHAGYRYEYGLLLRKNGQVQEAIAELQLAKAERARLGDCLLALGQCFQMIRQNKLAMTHYQEAVTALEPGESKKKALYLAMKLALTLEDYGQAESYGHQLAAIDFSYRDLGQILDQITRRET